MSVVTDTERTLAAAAEAIVGTLLCVGGVVLVRLSGFVVAIGIALLSLGVVAVAHAVALGLGLIDLPDKTRDRDRDEDD